ncbi:hypothetical protein ACG04R_27940 [Roseateles sp. BYS78W]|uniref:Uncharacterized protein n=1 Tax=Pelomonas candidula TaxID=3299025 RepID=A0ABW7HL49_9BURK
MNTWVKFGSAGPSRVGQISVGVNINVPPKLWAAFKKQTDDLFLSRAPFLDYMLSTELGHLRVELEGLKLSLRAKRHIAGAMKRTGPTSVNIEVRPETAEALRDAVRAHNLVRDAFMCRLIIFLRSPAPLLNRLEVPLIATGGDTHMWLEPMPSSPLAAMEAVRDDPLFYVRSHVQNTWDCGIYRVALPRSLDWAACYLEDEVVPGTAAHRRMQKEADAMLAELLDEPQAKSTRNAKRSKQ